MIACFNASTCTLENRNLVAVEEIIAAIGSCGYRKNHESTMADLTKLTCHQSNGGFRHGDSTCLLACLLACFAWLYRLADSKLQVVQKSRYSSSSE
jgi:hypothetical protein